MTDTIDKTERPNIVLFVSDDHGLDAGCYGNPWLQTPHMDRLAADGVRFTRAYCTASTCSPSRSVILSGLHNHTNGMYGLAHAAHHFQSFDNIRSLPMFLSDAGYRTASIGKYHVGPEQAYHFDTYLPANPRSPVEMADNSREFMADREPFFLYFCTTDPHRGGGTADDLPEKPDRFGNRPEGYPGVTDVVYDKDDVTVPSFLPDTPETRAELAQYGQSVSRLDQGIGKLVEILKELGKYENTLFIYISDNGAAFPEAKTTLYDPGMHLPCIVRSPRHSKRGGVCNGMVSWVDIAPTILDFADALPQDYQFHGRSFKNIIDQENPEGWDEVYASHTFHEVTMYYPMRVVRTNRYKFIWNIAHPLEYPFASDLWRSASWQSVMARDLTHFGKRTVEAYKNRPRYELYDIRDDPDELDNLAGNPGYGDVVEDMTDKIKAFQEDTGDPWLVKWTHE